ncbi:hypothetical protein Tco_0821301 [Tanacetum coccineum]|uniref:Uncharacterized protein n=1 Tax=Tanacetum coccineum TaxID=301880 RepID=A0ABQ5AF06_9ASTR
MLLESQLRYVTYAPNGPTSWSTILRYRLSYLAKDFENGLLNQLNEVKTLFNQIEAAVDQCSVDKKLFKIEKKELKLENERLLEHIITQDVVNIVIHADVKSVNVLPVQNTFLDHNIAIDMMKM